MAFCASCTSSDMDGNTLLCRPMWTTRPTSGLSERRAAHICWSPRPAALCVRRFSPETLSSSTSSSTGSFCCAHVNCDTVIKNGALPDQLACVRCSICIFIVGLLHPQQLLSNQLFIYQHLMWPKVFFFSTCLWIRETQMRMTWLTHGLDEIIENKNQRTWIAISTFNDHKWLCLFQGPVCSSGKNWKKKKEEFLTDK